MTAGTVVADLPTRRKAVLLRLDPKLYSALSRWAAEDFRSTNAQIEFLLHRVLVDAGRVSEKKSARARTA